jgi:hypothetical protein
MSASKNFLTLMLLVTAALIIFPDESISKFPGSPLADHPELGALTGK